MVYRCDRPLICPQLCTSQVTIKYNAGAVLTVPLVYRQYSLFRNNCMHLCSTVFTQQAVMRSSLEISFILIIMAENLFVTRKLHLKSLVVFELIRHL